jgi:hypothetical protein
MRAVLETRSGPYGPLRARLWHGSPPTPQLQAEARRGGALSSRQSPRRHGRPPVAGRMLPARTAALQQVENGVPIDQTRCDEFVFAYEFIRLVRHIECAGTKDYALGAD